MIPNRITYITSTDKRPTLNKDLTMKKNNKLKPHTTINVYPDRMADIEIDGFKTKVTDVVFDGTQITAFKVFAGYMFGIPLEQHIFKDTEYFDLCYEAAKNAKMWEIEKVA